MAEPISILVVCTGNICRSPTAEGVLREAAGKRGLSDRVRIASAGTHDYHVGEAPDPRAVRHASQRGYDLSPLRASQVSERDFHEHDYILAMDRGHLRILRAIAPSGAKARVGLFLDASARWEGEDVPDPYYGGVEGFERVLDMVEEAAERWLDRIEAQLEPGRFRLHSPR
ncbi:MAG TPA: low molecular weight protein-tyrosine-phosphatase [Usitatibacter sp.]|nr:low molecular weight protein-tyrosine-phosphatase [Usitatibacter sp.]